MYGTPWAELELLWTRSCISVSRVLKTSDSSLRTIFLIPYSALHMYEESFAIRICCRIKTDTRSKLSSSNEFAYILARSQTRTRVLAFHVHEFRHAILDPVSEKFLSVTWVYNSILLSPAGLTPVYRQNRVPWTFHLEACNRGFCPYKT